MSKILDTYYDKVGNKFIRFLVVGSVNFLFGTGIYCLLTSLGLSDWWSLLFSNILGVLFNFKTTGTLVFQNKKNSLIFIFAGCYTGIYLLEVLLTKCITLIFGVNDYWSGISAIIAGSLISYLLLKNLVFRENGNKKETD